jgi:hypothetical protein
VRPSIAGWSESSNSFNPEAHIGLELHADGPEHGRPAARAVSAAAQQRRLADARLAGEEKRVFVDGRIGEESSGTASASSRPTSDGDGDGSIVMSAAILPAMPTECKPATRLSGRVRTSRATPR